MNNLINKNKKIDVKKLARDLGMSEVQVKVQFDLDVNIDEVIKVYFTTPDGSTLSKKAKEKWKKISKEMVDNAKTIEEIEKAYYTCPPKSKLQQKAKLKWDMILRYSMAKIVNKNFSEKKDIQKLLISSNMDKYNISESVANDISKYYSDEDVIDV